MKPAFLMWSILLLIPVYHDIIGLLLSFLLFLLFPVCLFSVFHQSAEAPKANEDNNDLKEALAYIESGNEVNDEENGRVWIGNAAARRYEMGKAAENEGRDPYPAVLLIIHFIP